MTLPSNMGHGFICIINESIAKAVYMGTSFSKP